MFDFLIWMFENKDFKKHFLKLFCLIFIFWFPLFIITACIYMHNELFSAQIILYLKLAFIIALLLPFICVSGYFWSLTDNIIFRDTDIVTNSIYNKKIAIKNIIKLPEWNTKKFLWRGIASIVATVIMYIPFILVVGSSYLNVAESAEYWKWSGEQTAMFTNGIAIFAALFIPALLWNYARRNSVFAVLNIPKAVYIMGNYPFRYIKNTALFIIIYFIYTIIVTSFANVMGFSKELCANVDGYIVFSVTTDFTNIFIKLAILILGCYFISLYFMYVFAYLLGTLAPNDEY